MKAESLELLRLDAKDQKILAELFKDGRASYSKIGKNTHISKDVVKYRIEKFVEAGFMTNVNTIIDVSKLGWSSALVFFKLENFDVAKIKGFVDYLIHNPTVVEILEFAGHWDFAVRFYYFGIGHLNAAINQLELKFQNMVSEYAICFISRNVVLPYKVLFRKYVDREFYIPTKRSESLYNPDDIDLKILSAISFDSRKQLSELETELKENRMTIYNRIKKMVDSGVIDSFRPNLYTEKLGFHWYVVSVRLNDLSDLKINKVVEWLSSLESCHFIIPCFGSADCIFYCEVKTVQDLQRVLYDLRSEFSSEIRALESASVIRDYKWDFFPKGFLDLYKSTEKDAKVSTAPRISQRLP